ncbi:MAG TPA: hypothetical protein PLW65_07765 [Pseudomonadota bacterium]|nr:hypothetical protein [Pseudomonadota bacterium]
MTAGLALGAGGRAGAEPDTAAHLQRANELVSQDQLAAACDELAAAYKSSKDPLLWLRIGRLRLRLHQPTAAREAMQRFLDESPAPHPALKAEAQRALHELLAAPPPLLPPPPPPPPPHSEGAMSLYNDLRLNPIEFRPQRDRRLMKLGGALLAGGYLPALAVAVGFSPFVGQPDAPSAAANYTLLIPVLGPLISAVVAPATNEYGNARPLISSWSLPWALTSGLVQLAGFAVLVAGAVPHRVPVLAAQLQLLPEAGPSFAGLALRITPRYW